MLAEPPGPAAASFSPPGAPFYCDYSSFVDGGTADGNCWDGENRDKLSLSFDSQHSVPVVPAAAGLYAAQRRSDLLLSDLINFPTFLKIK